MLKDRETALVYGLVWGKSDGINLPSECHFDKMQQVIPVPIVRGKIGIDIGSGYGYDSYVMARNNPSANVVSLDISDGIYKTKSMFSDLDNGRFIKGSVLLLPFKNGIFDFAYSFGVLHHTCDPKKGLAEIIRVLKNGAPAFLYLYEDHSSNLIKYNAIKMLSLLRRFTTRMPVKVVYFLCFLFSPFVFIIFSLPAKMLRGFKATLNLSKNMPFNFGTGFFSLTPDLYDRFRAPIEYRFSREGVYGLFSECGFSEINIKRLNTTAGWVVWGYKK